MKTEELEKIFDYLIGDDTEGLLMYCQKLEIVPKEENDIEILYNALTQIIENDDDLMIYFKEYAKVNPEVHVLIPYFQKPENIRYFVENLKNISMADEIANQIEDNFRERNQKKKDQIKERDHKTNLFIKKYGVFFMIILEIIALFIAIDSLTPFVVTHIFKIAEVTDAVIVEQEKDLSFTNYFTSNIDLKYEYTVNGIQYTNEEHTFLVGIGIVDGTNKSETIKVYYYKNNPTKCKIYKRYYNIHIILNILCNILFIIGIIRLAKMKKQRN